MKRFNNYFENQVGYPKDIALNPLPLGTEYQYVSSDFLNGFINYVTIVKAHVLGRYHAWDEELQEPHTISVQEGSFNWVKKECKTKDELYAALTVKGATYHVHLDDDFQDDVLILAEAGKTELGQVCYVFFWYDRDCSDCCIGRFATDDCKEEVIEIFDRFVNQDLVGFGSNDHGAREIPLHYFQGWLRG